MSCESIQGDEQMVARQLQLQQPRHVTYLHCPMLNTLEIQRCAVTHQQLQDADVHSLGHVQPNLDATCLAKCSRHLLLDSAIISSTCP